MNSLAIAFLAASSLALLVLPRRWAPVPFVLGCCYMTLSQAIDLGPLTFTVLRILVAVGIVRVVVRGEAIAGGMNHLDWLMIAWALWALFSSRFHEPPNEALVYRAGMVWDACGIYFLFRCLCRSVEDVILLCRIVVILLVPVAVAMVYEKWFYYNAFSALGGVPATPMFRNNSVRCFGPFTHPILSGTVGAVCLPLAISQWKRHRFAAMVGIAACVSMVYASGSSGPIMSALAAIGALAMWPLRDRMRAVRWLAVALYLALDMVMKAPAYYLIGRIDITGGSTGWHRAALIESSLKHFREWWWAGTDYTRHWMPTGQSWNANHTDITNEYLSMGVVGGLPLMGLFIASLAVGFSYVGRTVKHETERAEGVPFEPWALGAALFAHAATSISVSYFDQSFMFIYLTLAAIASMWASTNSEAPKAEPSSSKASRRRPALRRRPHTLRLPSAPVS